MSFAFGFAGDDIEDDDEHDELAQQLENSTIDDTSLIPPRKHTLQALTSPSQRPDWRSVFDIRAQLMAEANPDDNDNESLLAGLERGDLTSGIYEGGFKTWECSLDLASIVTGLNFDGPLHIFELGAGSAIPSLVAIAAGLEHSAQYPLHFTLCDYNEDVLRLATAPNIFLASQLNVQRAGPMSADGDDLEIEDIDDTKADLCLQRYQTQNITFDLVSGAWGDDFLHLIDSTSSAQSTSMLILASETIYSPKSTRIFVDTLMQLLQRNTSHNRAWVAAKKVYFGVGGGVDDFVDQVMKQRGTVEVLHDIKDAGVGRVILEVRAA